MVEFLAYAASSAGSGYLAYLSVSYLKQFLFQKEEFDTLVSLLSKSYFIVLLVAGFTALFAQGASFAIQYFHIDISVVDVTGVGFILTQIIYQLQKKEDLPEELEISEDV